MSALTARRDLIDRELAAIPPSTPVLIMLGDTVTILGVLESAAGYPGTLHQRINVIALAEPCTCTTGAGQRCPRHRPQPPPSLLARLMPAARAARDHGQDRPDDEQLATIVHAVLTELIAPSPAAATPR